MQRIFTICSAFLIAIGLTFAMPNWAVAENVPEPVPEPAPIRAGDIMLIDPPTDSQWYSGYYISRGSANLLLNHIPNGCVMYVQSRPTSTHIGGDGMTLISPTTVDEWARRMNGSVDYVEDHIDDCWTTVEYQGQTYKYIHTRDLAELCGMHYYDSVHWGPASS